VGDNDIANADCQCTLCGGNAFGSTQFLQDGSNASNASSDSWHVLPAAFIDNSNADCATLMQESLP
jgi:hypothetical protein